MYELRGFFARPEISSDKLVWNFRLHGDLLKHGPIWGSVTTLREGIASVGVEWSLQPRPPKGSQKMEPWNLLKGFIGVYIGVYRV